MTLLIAWLWQGTLVAVGAVALLGLCPRVNATTRHLCLWLALVSVLALPAVEGLGPGASQVGTEAAVETATSAGEPDIQQATTFLAPALPAWLPAAGLAAWGLAAILGVLRIFIGLAGLARLKRSAECTPELVDRLRAWRRSSPHRRRITLGVTDLCAAPCAAGLGSPTILLPRALVGRLSARELDALVLHEHAHLVRYDDWTQLAQRIAGAVAGLHPAVWLLSRRIDLEREAACDDWVLERTLPPDRYARCLVDVASMLQAAPNRLSSTLIAPAVGSRRSLRARVARLLDRDVDHDRRPAASAVAVAALALACGSVVVHLTTPTVMFADRDPDPVAFLAPHSDPSDPAYEPSPPMAAPARFAPPSAPRRVEAPAEAAPTARPARRAELRPALPAVAGAPQVMAVHTLEGAGLDAPHLSPVGPMPEAGESAPGPWGRLAAAGSGIGTHAGRTGAALGKGMQHAGSSIGAMFGRAARSIADSF